MRLAVPTGLWRRAAFAWRASGRYVLRLFESLCGRFGCRGFLWSSRKERLVLCAALFAGIGSVGHIANVCGRFGGLDGSHFTDFLG